MMATAFSLRSQRSWALQRELEGRLGVTGVHANLAEKEIARLSETIELQVRAHSTASPGDPGILDQAMERKKHSESKLKLYRGCQRDLRRQIKALESPPRAELKNRRERQARIAELGRQRKALDSEIGKACRALQELLEKREEMSKAMKEDARAIDLDLADLFLQSSLKGVAMALMTLPEDFAKSSSAWLDWLLGQEAGTRTYVAQHGLTLPETLVNTNIFRAGEIVTITPERVRNLGLEDGDFPALERVQKKAKGLRSSAAADMPAA